MVGTPLYWINQNDCWYYHPNDLPMISVKLSETKQQLQWQLPQENNEKEFILNA